MKDGKMAIVFRRHYTKPIAKVWAALTVPERLADWFGAATIDLRVGGTLRLSFENDATMEMRITRLEPPHILSFSWDIGGADTAVLFELQPEGSGCQLTLTHSGFNARGQGVRAGWHAHLEGLADSLDGRATPFSVKEQREAVAKAFYPPMPV
jgi:uncharacterized protein YndB with AHSA1/START domain